MNNSPGLLGQWGASICWGNGGGRDYCSLELAGASKPTSVQVRLSGVTYPMGGHEKLLERIHFSATASVRRLLLQMQREFAGSIARWIASDAARSLASNTDASNEIRFTASDVCIVEPTTSHARRPTIPGRELKSVSRGSLFCGHPRQRASQTTSKP